MSAGDWWDVRFNFYQASVSLILIVAVLACYRTWWAKSFACVALCQIAINTYDAIMGLHFTTYNAAQSVLNALEFVLLFGVGGFMELRQAYEHHRDAAGTPDCPDNNS